MRNFDITYFSNKLNLSKNYCPFGMVTPGRSFAAGSGYRYGFNGKESDPETYGSGNIYDYGFRIYNPRLGKFLSVDPLNRLYPNLTSYQYASNTPIWAIDLDGLEAVIYPDVKGNKDKDINKTDDNLSVVKIEDIVYITHYYNGSHQYIQFNLDGVSSEELREANAGSYWEKAKFARKHPYIYQHRQEFNFVNEMSKTFFRKDTENKKKVVGLSQDFVTMANSGGGIDGKKMYEYGDAFQHVTGSALMTILVDEEFAAYAGDMHERDVKDGYLSIRQDASITDLINNSYGIELGGTLSAKYDFSNGATEEQVAEFLNEVSSYIINSFPELINSKVVYTKDNENVKQLTKQINDLKK